ncbi:hypothetical protein ACE6H2_006997 [Prunus campanulata]
MVRNLGFGRSWQKSRPVAMVEDEDGDGDGDGDGEEKWIYFGEGFWCDVGFLWGYYIFMVLGWGR